MTIITGLAAFLLPRGHSGTLHPPPRRVPHYQEIADVLRQVELDRRREEETRRRLQFDQET